MVDETTHHRRMSPHECHPSAFIHAPGKEPVVQLFRLHHYPRQILSWATKPVTVTHFGRMTRVMASILEYRTPVINRGFGEVDGGRDTSVVQEIGIR